MPVNTYAQIEIIGEAVSERKTFEYKCKRTQEMREGNTLEIKVYENGYPFVISTFNADFQKQFARVIEGDEIMIKCCSPTITAVDDEFGTSFLTFKINLGKGGDLFRILKEREPLPTAVDEEDDEEEEEESYDDYDDNPFVERAKDAPKPKSLEEKRREEEEEADGIPF